jgi:sporulation protein YlmC with PRC-barrel domain
MKKQILLATAVALSFTLADLVRAAEVLQTIPSGLGTVSDWYKQSVYDPSDKKIGTINDVLLSKEGKAEVLVVGVGGFVGVGQKDVAVPLSAVSMTTKNNKAYLVMSSTKDELSKAPGFKFDRTARTWGPDEPRPTKKK